MIFRMCTTVYIFKFQLERGCGPSVEFTPHQIQRTLHPDQSRERNNFSLIRTQVLWLYFGFY